MGKEDARGGGRRRERRAEPEFTGGDAGEAPLRGTSGGLPTVTLPWGPERSPISFIGLHMFEGRGPPDRGPISFISF